MVQASFRLLMAATAAGAKYAVRRLPASVKGMTVFKEEVFDVEVRAPFVAVKREMIGAFKKIFGDYLLRVPNFRSVREIENVETVKRVILDPDKIQQGLAEDMEEKEVAKVKEYFPESLRLDFEAVTLKFENWTPHELLEAVLEKEKFLGSYSIIGDILHVNLKDYHEPQKKVIGEILHRRVKGIRTVVNKLGAIDTEFRYFQMEVLAGEERGNYEVEVKHNGLTFRFDFAKVYWNPRLGTEHERIAAMIGRGDVLVDVFAGVGPFSVSCAKKRKKNGVQRVYANDLNPESYKWLKENVAKNKVSDVVEAHNLDGRDFIRTVGKKALLEKARSAESEGRAQFVMNLPALAIEFLDAFVGLLADSGDVKDNNVAAVVHVHGFSETQSEIVERCVAALGGRSPHDMSVTYVRNVAPKKDMFRATFKLTKDILFDSVETEAKRRKIE